MEDEFPRSRSATGGRYTETLRNMFAKINPYNLSCLYKETFESHAVETLLACGDETSKPCMQTITNISESRYKSLSKKLDSQQKCGLCLKEEIELIPLYDESRSSFSIEDFYAKMKLKTCSDCAHYDHEILGWKTCKKTHVDSLDCILKHGRPLTPTFIKLRHESPKQTRSVLGRKQIEFNMMPPYLNKIYKSTFQASSSEEGMNVLNEMRNERTIASANTKSKYPKTELKKRDTHHKNNNCKNVTPSRSEPTQQDDVFKFYHDLSRSQYIEQYKRCSSHREIDPNCIPKMIITKARVKCQDVRKGACIEPTPNVPSVKLAHFNFKVNCKLRTSNPTLIKRKAASTTPVTVIPPEPPSMGGGITGVAVMTDLSTLSTSLARSRSCKSCSPSPICTTPQKPMSPSKSPVICRSRPTIPSNARGIVCDTAIETPKYVIQGVTGHSLSRQGRNKSPTGMNSPGNTTFRPASCKMKKESKDSLVDQ